jgi:hypothetical protein
MGVQREVPWCLAERSEARLGTDERNEESRGVEKIRRIFDAHGTSERTERSPVV